MKDDADVTTRISRPKRFTRHGTRIESSGEGRDRRGFDPQGLDDEIRALLSREPGSRLTTTDHGWTWSLLED